MADTSNLTTFLGDVADAIREKKGTELPIPAADFDTEIRSITTGSDTSDATAVANDIIYPKTAYIYGGKVTGAIIPTYIQSSLDGTTYSKENTNMFQDIDLTNKTALTYNNENIIIYKLNDNFGVEKNLTIPISWNTNSTKTVVSAQLFKGDFVDGYVIYVMIFDTVSPYSTITRIEVSKDLEQIISTVTYNDTYQNFYNTEQAIMIYESNVAVPSPVDPYEVAFISLNVDQILTYIYISKLTFSDESVVRSNSEGIDISYIIYRGRLDTISLNLTFDMTGKYLSFYLYSYNDARSPGYVSVYNFETMFEIYDLVVEYSTGCDAVPLLNLDDGIYSIFEDKLVLLSENGYSNVNDIDTSGLNGDINYVTYQDNLFLLKADKLSRYILKADRTGFYIQDEISGVNNFNCYQAGVWSNDSTNIYYWESQVGDLYSLDVSGTKLYSTKDSDASVSDILQGKKVYNSTGKITGTMPNNGELNYTPSTSEQIIPAGYTSGGTIEASPQTTEDYNSCIAVSNQILAGINYIQGNGSDMVDIGIIPKTGSTIVELDIASGELISWEPIFSCQRDQFQFGRYGTDNYFHLKIGGASYNQSNAVYNEESTHVKIDTVNGIYEVGDESFTCGKTFSNDITLKLYYGVNDGSYGKSKIYNCKISIDNELVRDLVPAYINGKYGFYDNISKQFFTSTNGNLIGG